MSEGDVTAALDRVEAVSIHAEGGGGLELPAAIEAASEFIRVMTKIDSLCRLSYRDPKAALDAMQKVRIPFRLPWLEDAIMTAMAHNCMSLVVKERDIREEFYDNLERYIPGARQLKRPSDAKNVPDGFLQWNNLEVPVEIKRSVFDGAALLQLQRYMRFYDSERGVAVAPRLAVDLPENILFVSVWIGERA